MADATRLDEPDADDIGFVSRFVSAPDGLRLHARLYGARGRGLPIVCLPGLTRNGADFHPIATALTSDAAHPRLVITIDSRVMPKPCATRSRLSWTRATRCSFPTGGGITSNR